MEAATSRSKVQSMLNELEDNNRLIEMQRIEIGRWREQVQVMVESSGGNGGDGRSSVGGNVITDTYFVNENDQQSDMPPAFVMSQSQSQPAMER
jgi:hypothetical protein